MVNAETGNVSSNHSADLQFFVSLKNPVYIASEDARLQPICGLVDLSQRLRKVVVGLERDHRSKNLPAVHTHLRTRPRQHRRLENRSLPPTATEQSCSLPHRCLHPLRSANRIALADQRTQVGRFVQRVTDFQLADPVQQEVTELRERRSLHQNSLYRDASLARVAKSSANAALCRPSQISVGMNNHAGIPSQFERNFLLARTPLDVPSYRHAAGKADQLDPFVGNQQPGVLVRK